MVRKGTVLAKPAVPLDKHHEFVGDSTIRDSHRDVMHIWLDASIKDPLDAGEATARVISGGDENLVRSLRLRIKLPPNGSLL